MPLVERQKNSSGASLLPELRHANAANKILESRVGAHEIEIIPKPKFDHQAGQNRRNATHKNSRQATGSTETEGIFAITDLKPHTFSFAGCARVHCIVAKPDKSRTRCPQMLPLLKPSGK
jgi:thioredoxin reductase